MARRREEDVQETLNEVHKILLNLIMTKGWRNITFTTLSKATGQSRSTILHHFDSREGLYNWMKESVLDQLILDMESVGINKTNPHLINFFLAGCLDHGCGVLEDNFNSIEVGQMVFRSIEKHPSNN